MFDKSKIATGIFSLKNMTILGGSAATVDNLHASIERSHMVIAMNMSLPQMKTSGWFKSNITVNRFPFVSQGKFKMICDDLTALFTVSGDINESGRFTASNLEMMPTVKNMKFEITRLTADETLSKQKNRSR